jgi:hypothetical protein
MRKFEVTIWEKAEHWTFQVKVEAQDEAAARKQIARDYSRKSYTVRSIHEVR